MAFTGFGKFTTQRRAERQGVNPRNPTEKVTIPAATVPKFTAGSQLKQAVKSGGGGYYPYPVNVQLWTTCEDHVQNGDESGIDCGGAFCRSCPTRPTP